LYGYKATTVDIETKYKPSICKDILKLKLCDIPQRNNITLVWASIPCTVYSIQSLRHHWYTFPYANRQYYYLPKSKESLTAIRILEKTLWLLRKINPQYFIIENPRGALRHMPQISAIPFRHTVSYSDYNSPLYKPTDLFTNIPGLHLKPIRTAVGRTFTGSVNELQSAYQRSVVPEALIIDILQQLVSPGRTS
jgi:site-specific DNA-cytosine methylase